MAERKPAPLILLISAPSGAGKTTLCDGLLAACPDLVRAVTCTTRAPRPGELQGRDYYFLTKEDFKQRVTAGEFLEHASVYDNHYGLLKGELLAKLHAGKDVLLNVDVQGAASIRMAAALEPELKAALVTLFLTTESLELLAHRLNKRNADDPAVIAKRLAAAKPVAAAGAAKSKATICRVSRMDSCISPRSSAPWLSVIARIAARRSLAPLMRA